MESGKGQEAGQPGYGPGGTNLLRPQAFGGLGAEEMKKKKECCDEKTKKIETS